MTYEIFISKNIDNSYKLEIDDFNVFLNNISLDDLLWEVHNFQDFINICNNTTDRSEFLYKDEDFYISFNFDRAETEKIVKGAILGPGK